MSVDALLFDYIVKEETFKDGDVIIEEGSTGYWINVVMEGKVKVKKITPKGMITINTLKEGNFFGEMVFLQTGEKSRFASVVADGTAVIGTLDAERLTMDLNTLSPRLKKLINTLLNRRREATEKLITLMLNTK
jgi:CRP-like cAMP-binding protein